MGDLLNWYIKIYIFVLHYLFKKPKSPQIIQHFITFISVNYIRRKTRTCVPLVIVNFVSHQHLTPFFRFLFLPQHLHDKANTALHLSQQMQMQLQNPCHWNANNRSEHITYATPVIAFEREWQRINILNNKFRASGRLTTMMVNTRWTLALVLVGVTAMAVAASNNQQKDFLFESTAGDEGHLQVSEMQEIYIILKLKIPLAYSYTVMLNRKCLFHM